MRKITIREYVCPDPRAEYTGNSLYQVFLGNSVRRYFSNLKHVKNYLAEVNRFLNNWIHELNYIYIYVFGEYRRNWFYFESQQSAHRGTLIKTERDILGNFNAIDRAFNMVVRRSALRNGNYVTFHLLLNICDELQKALGNLKTVMLDRKYYAEVQRLDMFAGQIDTLREKLHNYGKPPNVSDSIN